MTWLSKLDSYRENNRIEAKKAEGGLPKSLWETYSSFANTMGGMILLGVEERPDKTLAPSGVKDPEALIKDFWDIINNPQKVSVNILSDKWVTVEELEGKRIVVIKVPRAERADKPVYIGSSPMTGSYRRNGEGDYKCKAEEVRAMLRDASVTPMDMQVLENTDFEVFDKDSLRRYRIRMKSYRPGHVWEELEDIDFLYRLGALGRGKDGDLHPTAAGLLMFGQEYEIVKEFPDYFLDYREQLDENSRWTDRIVSSSGDWSGNIYDFYFRVYNKLTQSVKVPFKLENGARIEDTPVHKALREAIANCLINADYRGKRGIVIIHTNNEIGISNPGGFRIEPETAKVGGVSDPRNAVLMKMFNLIDIGERAGSGIPNIYAVWEKAGCGRPTISESFTPERTTVTLNIQTELSAESSEKSAAKNKKLAETVGGKSPTNGAVKPNPAEKNSNSVGGNSTDLNTQSAAKNKKSAETVGGKLPTNPTVKPNPAEKNSNFIGGNSTDLNTQSAAKNKKSAETVGGKSPTNGAVKPNLAEKNPQLIGGNSPAPNTQSAAKNKKSAETVGGKLPTKPIVKPNPAEKNSNSVGGNSTDLDTQSAAKNKKSAETVGGKLLTKPTVKPNSAEKNSNSVGGKLSAEHKKLILKYIKKHGSAKTAELAKEIGMSVSRTKDYLKQLAEEGAITPEGMSRSRRYRLNNKN